MNKQLNEVLNKNPTPKRLARATKTFEEFNYILDEFYDGNSIEKNEYLNIINDTKSKQWLINKRLFTTFKGF